MGGSPAPSPAPMPPVYYQNYDEELMIWNNIRRLLRKDNIEPPVEADTRFIRGMNWDEIRIAVLSATCFVLFLLLVISWLRSYKRRMTETKARLSFKKVVNKNKKMSGESGNSSVVSNFIRLETKVQLHQNMESALWKKMLSISVEEMKVLRSFEIDSAVLEVKERIGLGSFSDVHLGMFRGTPVAVKILRNSDQESLKRFKEEILLMKSLRHPNIVQLYGPCWNTGKFMIVTELFIYGNLADVLSNVDLDLTWPKEKYYMICDIVRGMAYLHGVKYYDYSSKKYEHCILHRDLKPQNMLVTGGFHIKISDFGEARALDTDYTMTQVGTLLYIAPEIVRGEKYGEKCDVYSFGVILLAMLIKKGMLVFQVFAEELERRKSMGEAKVSTASLPLSEVYNPDVSEGSSAEEGKIRRAPISQVKRKHTPHVVTEAIVNDHLRPTLPEGALKSLSLLTTQAWDPDPAKRPTFNGILDYIESIVKDEVMYGVPINDDCLSSPSEKSPFVHDGAVQQSDTKSSDVCSHYSNSPLPAALSSEDPVLNTPSGTPEQWSPDIGKVLAANNNGDLKSRIERMNMRSKGQYAPERDHVHISMDLDELYRSLHHRNDMNDSDVVQNGLSSEKHQLHGPFAVPSAAARLRHRRKSYDKGK